MDDSASLASGFAWRGPFRSTRRRNVRAQRRAPLFEEELHVVLLLGNLQVGVDLAPVLGRMRRDLLLVPVTLRLPVRRLQLAQHRPASLGKLPQTGRRISALP